MPMFPPTPIHLSAAVNLTATQFRRHEKACLVLDISIEARPSARSGTSRTGTQTGHTRRHNVPMYARLRNHILRS